MHPTRALALAAAVVLLTGCQHKSEATGDQPSALTTTSPATTAAATATATRAAATTTPRGRTASPTAAAQPTSHRITVGPTMTSPTARATTSRTPPPTPKPTTSRTPKPVVTTPPPATGTTQLSISGHAFSPRTLSVPRGTTVRATNHDAQAHTWTSASGVWDSGNLNLGQSFSYRFMTKGTFAFVCSYHSDMTGRVTVI